MLTPDQIKNLTYGDPIIISATFRRIDYEGDIWFKLPGCNAWKDRLYIDPEFVSLPSKHGTSVPTPEEELEPYSVVETMSRDGWKIVRDGLPLVIYDSQRHPNAKASAEAECDRLNAEHRKEQK